MGTAAGKSHVGYRVLSVAANSPAAVLGLEPMLDFVALPEGNDFYQHADNFISLLQKHENKTLEFTVYNLADRTRRKIGFEPRKWAGPGLAGIDLRLEEYGDPAEGYSNIVFHVLSILVDSPLSKAGVHPFKDYILGARRQTFRSVSDFSNFLRKCNRTPVELFVYSAESEEVRTVIVVPNDTWGGSGLLGGDIGFGQEHQIPPRNKKKATAAATTSTTTEIRSDSKEDAAPEPGINVAAAEKKAEGNVII